MTIREVTDTTIVFDMTKDALSYDVFCKFNDPSDWNEKRFGDIITVHQAKVREL